MKTLPEGLSPAAFIAWESEQEVRHEFVRGRISAFPGGTVRHAVIGTRVATQLTLALSEAPCLVMASDMLVTTEYSLRYADVLVTFDERDMRDAGQRTVHHPRLIVEVLSESTASVDRGPKFAEYRTIDTLEEFVLIDSRLRWAQTHRLIKSGWIPSTPISTGRLDVVSVDVALDIDALYVGLGLPSA